jgi:hypothetical protein
MSEERSRVVESLETAAQMLEAARAGHEVRAALRDGLLGVEYHSDTLAKELAKDPASPGAFEPALRGRAERVEANLHSLLVTAWELLTLSDDDLATTPLRATLVKALRAAETAEIALVFDQLLTPEGID